MSRMLLLRLTPSKYMRQELQKELGFNRVWLNHYEFVDFTIFDYGHRGQYLQWRIFSLIVTVLLTSHVFFSIGAVAPHATPYSRLIYVHVWLNILVIAHSVLEVIMLCWTFYTIPNPILVRMHNTPWNFKLLWLMYNTLYPNIMACNLMYYVVLKDMEVQIGESRLFNALLASFVGIQISVTATPSRLAHMVQPLLFNVIHVVFTAIYQMLGYTNPAGKNYVYLEMDWVNSRSSATVSSVVWILVTSSCHLLMVGCCWYRRLVYRCRRTKSTRPVYGFSPEEYMLSDDSTGQLKELYSQLENHKNEKIPKFGRRILYSPHLSYRRISSRDVAARRDRSERSALHIKRSSVYVSLQECPRDRCVNRDLGSDVAARYCSRSPKRSRRTRRASARVCPHQRSRTVCYSSKTSRDLAGAVKKKKRKRKRRDGVASVTNVNERGAGSLEGVTGVGIGSTSSEEECLEAGPRPVVQETGDLKTASELGAETRTEAASEAPARYISDEENDSLSESIGHSGTAFLL